MLRSLIEIFGRGVSAFTVIILALISEPRLNAIPELAPYSTHIIYTAIVIMGLWITVPLIDLLWGYTHTHEG